MPVCGDKLFVVASSTSLIKYFLLINLVSCENVFKYISLKDETGSLVCANARPDVVIYRIRSAIACATSCSSDSQCEDFNFSSRLQLCELFYSSQILQFQISRNCVFYTKRTNMAVVNSMATVNNGAAYTTKVLTRGSDNVSTISTVATGTTDATGTKTTATTSQPTSSTFAGQTSASKTEKITISSNNISSTGGKTLQTTTGSTVGSTTAATIKGGISGALYGATFGTTTKPNAAFFGQTSATITQAAAVAQPIITTTPATSSTTTKTTTTIPISNGITSTITASTKAATLSSTSTTKITSVAPTSAVSTSTTTSSTTIEASTKTTPTLVLASSSSTTTPTTAATSKTSTQSSTPTTTKLTTTSPVPAALASTTTSATTVVVTTTKTIPTSTITTTTTTPTTSATTSKTTTTSSSTSTTAKTTTIPIPSTTLTTVAATTTIPTSKSLASTTTTKTSVMQTTKATTTIKTTAKAASAQVTGPTGLPYQTSGLVQQPSSSILIQNNVNTPNAFNRPWLDFKNGFGDSNGNYWLGNDAIHNYMTGHQYQLYIYVYPVNVVYPYQAIYQYYFSLGDSTSNYQLGLGMSGGNATSDGMGPMSNSMFSTSDKDNDVDPQNNCATTYGSGWWYGGNPLSNGYQCGTTMLNGCGNNFVWAQDTTLTLRASQMWLVY